MEEYTLITGATEGIGYELAKLFAKEKNNLILVARNLENLKEVKKKLEVNNIKIKLQALDLSNINQCEELIKYTKENNIIVNKLINNAGVGNFEFFKDGNWENYEKLIDLNMKAVTKLTNYYLKEMINNNEGGVLNIASTAAFSAGPKMAIYYASKAYVLNLTEAIHEEVKDSNIKISCLCPGPVKTEFQNKAGIKKSESAKKYLMDARDVAKIGYKEFEKGKVIIIPGIKNKMLVVLNKFIPRKVSRSIIYKINK